VIYALILLQVLDIATTHYALRTGIGTEANPVLRKLFDRFGHEPVLLVSKAAFIAFVWYFQDLIHPLAYGLLLGLYIWVVANNVQVILKAKKR
jgi:predicted PurR-regulated permease PerM